MATGTVASGSASGLTAAGAPFTSLNLSPEAINFRYQNPTQLGTDYVVRVISGAAAWQSRRIASNTASGLTIEYPWGVVPAPGDTFEVSAKDADLSFSGLFAYQLNWQTVLYLGYGDDSSYYTDTARLEPSSQELFLKISYAWQR